jgi:hypothetical protein
MKKMYSSTFLCYYNYIIASNAKLCCTSFLFFLLHQPNGLIGNGEQGDACYNILFLLCE